MLEAVVEYPGIESIESFSYSMGHGVQPGVMSLTILPQDTSKIKDTGTLELSYGGKKRKMKNVLCDAASFSFNSGGGTIQLTLKDYRWTWAYTTITGAYNLRDADGSPLVLEGAKKNDNDVLGNSKRSLKELCKICLDAMGVEDKKQNVNDVPDNIYPPVAWDNENAAQALHQLIEQFDFRLAPSWNGGANLVKAGAGKKLPANAIQLIESEGLELDPQERPEFIRLVTNPILFSVDFELEAVGEDTDGIVKPLEECSWFTPDMYDFADAPEVESDIEDLVESPEDLKYTINALVRKTCFKWWRIKLPELGMNNSSPNKALKKFEKDYGEIKYVEQFLPLSDILPDMELDVERKAKIPKRAFAFGRYERDGDFGGPSLLDSEKIDFDNVDSPSPGKEEQRKVVVAFGMNMDTERGIVVFDRPVYSLGDDGKPISAVLYLRAGCYIKDIKTAVPVRFVKEKKEKAGSAAKYMTINVQEADPWYSVTGADNEDEIDEIINRYGEEISEMFERLESEVATYIGLVFEPIDGALREISWTIDAGGATTTIGRNTDRSRRGSLGYMRRTAIFEDKIARAKIDRQDAVMLWVKTRADIVRNSIIKAR
jgi:hypothetical protein